MGLMGLIYTGIRTSAHTWNRTRIYCTTSRYSTVELCEPMSYRNRTCLYLGLNQASSPAESWHTYRNWAVLISYISSRDTRNRTESPWSQTTDVSITTCLLCTIQESNLSIDDSESPLVTSWVIVLSTCAYNNLKSLHIVEATILYNFVIFK